MRICAQFGLKKLSLKNRWNLQVLYLILLLKTHEMCKFHGLFKCNIWAQNELILPFLILVMHTKSIFTNFCHLSLLFSNFYHFLPPSANFHYLPPSFASSQLYATFHQSKMVLFFFFFIFWHATIPPSCWMPCYIY